MSDALTRAREAGIPIHSFDLERDPVFREDPFAGWDVLGEQGPLFYSPAARGFFVATTYDLIRQVLTDPVTWRTLPSQLVHTTELIEQSIAPVTSEGKEHRDLRAALNPLFNPKVAEALEPRTREIVHELIEPFIANGGGDFVTGFASRLPAIFFLEWLGLPTDQVEEMFDLAMRGNYDFETNEGTAANYAAISAIIRTLFEERLKEPRDDLATRLVQMKVDGKPLPMATLVETGNLLFVAGQETTASMLGYSFMWLAQHPEERQKIVDDPALIPIALEEMFRVNSTGGSVGRTAAADTELGGCPIRKGDRVFIARCTADRASAPDIDIARWPNRHTAFTLGAHRCLGSNVARMELVTALTEWHARIPHYRIADGWVPHHHSGFMQALTSLPLEII